MDRKIKNLDLHRNLLYGEPQIDKFDEQILCQKIWPPWGMCSILANQVTDTARHYKLCSE